MKTSLILIALIFLNTSVLIAEPISNLLTGVNIWVLVVVETFLVIGYYINNLIKDVRKISEIDLSNLKLFVIGKKKSA